MNQAQAILWAQWRTVRNFSPLRGGKWLTSILPLLWYVLWLIAAFAAERLFSGVENVRLIRAMLPGALLLMFLYWQVVPLLLATTGATLELRKLLAYPIPTVQLFLIEAMLRVTSGIEVLLMLAGASIGILFNPGLSGWGAFGALPYVLFNLMLAVGLRDLLVRVLSRKRVREIVFLVFICLAAVPQMLLLWNRAAESRLKVLFTGDPWWGWPWTASGNLMQGRELATSLLIVAGWTLAAAVFGAWQFGRTLVFDAQAAAAVSIRPITRSGILERFYRMPSALFRDPLGAMVEKDLRSLARSSRFRLVFLMGFTFGLVVWLPLALGRSGLSRSFLSANYLTVVSVYSLLLLSEVCFWNSFGFDRSAAQIYFLAPVPFPRVLLAKNVSAMIFIVIEISAITLVCTLLGMPLKPRALTEAYSVAAVISLFLLSAGNLLSVHHAHGVNPSGAFRSGVAGRLQAMLMFIYPIAFIPAGLAYLARFAFQTDLAFFGVLAADAVLGLILYRVTLESSAAAAEGKREAMLAALSMGEAPIAS